MRAPRVLPALLSLGFLTLALATAFIAPMALAKAQTLEITDPTGDVKIVAAGAGSPQPPNSEGLDLTGGSIFGGDGRTLLIRGNLVNLFKETNYPPAVTDKELFIACFAWNDVVYGARVTYRIASSPVYYQRQLGPVDGTCDPTTDIAFAGGKFDEDTLGVQVDYAKSRVTLSIDRVTLGKLGGSPPVAGDTIGKLRVIATDLNHDRYDAAPDNGPATETFTLASSTTNIGDLVASPVSNVLVPLACNGRIDAPAYVVDAGGAHGVPITLRNRGASMRHVKFTVETIDGLDWKARVVPQLDVPPSSDGNTTVTVIVEMPEGTKHKDCTMIHLIAVDAEDPGVAADASVNVIAVRAPDQDAHKLFLHSSSAARNACNSNQMWINTLENDPDAADKRISFINCRANAFATGLSLDPIAMSAVLDANPSRDLVVNTSATNKEALAVLRLSSTSLPTPARISVTLGTAVGDGDVIGEGSVDVSLTSTVQDVKIPLAIGFTRDEVPTGDPSRIVPSDEGLRLSFRYAPLPSQQNPPIGTMGQVELTVKGSFVDIPIWNTIRRNHVDPGLKGFLLSVKPVGVLPGFAAPGNVRLFNYTILNEGASPDVALLSATFTGAKDWTATFSPGDKIALAPGESKTIQAAVLVPASAPESQSVLFDFKVTSEKDPTATASVATKIIASNEATVPREKGFGPNVKGDGGGLLPAPSALAALAGLAAAVATRRRRRAPPSA